ncbi:MAG: hypothetical protein HYU51_18385 [Candidatus Rokubacteria bacterium]|nr:hypothetical protein [Candidatus Rokubacteria bacterium]
MVEKEAASKATKRGPTISQRAAAFVINNQAQQICTGCLSKALGLMPQAITTVMPKLEGHRRLSVRYGTCSRCQQRRLIVATAAQNDVGPRPNVAAPMAADIAGDELL